MKNTITILALSLALLLPSFADEAWDDCMNRIESCQCDLWAREMEEEQALEDLQFAIDAYDTVAADIEAIQAEIADIENTVSPPEDHPDWFSLQENLLYAQENYIAAEMLFEVCNFIYVVKFFEAEELRQLRNDLLDELQQYPPSY